jgi:DNA-binding NtrC family response regulator
VAAVSRLNARCPAYSDAELEVYLSPAALRIRQLSMEWWGEQRALEIVGRHPDLLAALAKVQKFGRYREPVLVTGESGAGKEGFGQALFLFGHAKGAPFVSVNCPQYQEGNLTVSELFGHARGSFTGAVSDHRGAFEEAHGGALFLDEIGDLNQGAQAMLLRTLSTGELKPLGASRVRQVDVRVISATNRPLNQLVMTQQFRYDLFFRLRHFHVHVPALRERGDDWRLLLDFALLKLAKQYGVAKRFSPDALRLLEHYPWPGNVRQLLGITAMGYAMADGDVIEPSAFANLLDGDGASPDDDREALYERVVNGEGFWTTVYEPFLNRDLNRAQVRAIVERGLLAAGGSYRRLLGVFHLTSEEYQRFMDCLRHHDLKPRAKFVAPEGEAV